MTSTVAKASETSTGCSTDRHIAAIRLVSLTAGPTTVKSSRSLLPTFYHESAGAGMRGAFVDQGRLFSYIAPEARVPIE